MTYSNDKNQKTPNYYGTSSLCRRISIPSPMNGSGFETENRRMAIFDSHSYFCFHVFRETRTNH